MNTGKTLLATIFAITSMSLFAADIPLSDTAVYMPCGKNDVILTR